MFKFMIKKILIGYRKYYVIMLIIINFISFLFNLTSRQMFAEYTKNLICRLENYNSAFILFFINIIISHFIEYGSQCLLERQIICIVKGVLNSIIVRIVYYDIKYFKNNSNGKINQLWYYLQSAESLIKQIIIKIPKIIAFVLYYVYMAYNLSHMSLLFYVPINILIILIQQFLIEQQHTYRQNMIKADLMAKNRFLEVTSNIEYVKLKNQQNFEIVSIMSHFDEYIKHKLYDTNIYYIIKYMSYIFGSISTLMVYYVGIDIALKGFISPVQLIFLGINTYRLHYELIDLRNVYDHYNRNKSKIDIIYDMLVNNKLEYIDGNKDSLKLNNKDIRFMDVTFGYNEYNNVLNKLNIIIKHNHINLMIGPNGSGKSTIIKLLLRLYDLKKMNGNIYYGDINILNMNIRYLRNEIIFISQEPFIFDDTVINNIKYGNENICDRKIHKICYLLNSKDWIIKNYNKKCGFRGCNLSGSERKLIQLINAICKDSTYIVFDEPSNVLDSSAIKWFMDFIKILKKKFNRTIVLITHDSRLNDVAENIIKIPRN